MDRDCKGTGERLNSLVGRMAGFWVSFPSLILSFVNVFVMFVINNTVAAAVELAD